MRKTGLWVIVALALVTAPLGAQTISLLVDSDFEASSDSAALRANSASQDWYESGQDYPALLTLDSTNVAGNATKKAKLTATPVGRAYLTQEFISPQTQVFTVQWDIYVDSILDRPNSPYDRAAWVFIGDDTGTTPDRSGPNAEDSERFVYLGFYKAGGGSSGTMDLVAREASTTETTFATVATGLSLKRWYTLKVICDPTQSTYDVYLNGQRQGTVKARTPKSSLTHISFGQWSQDEGTATFYVDNVMAAGSGPGSRSAPACGPLLVDSDFNASSDSTALRANSAGRDWYESRHGNPGLLTLDRANVSGNATAKAKLTAGSPTVDTDVAYLTQEFCAPQTQAFWAQWDIYVDSIVDSPTNPDRAAWMLIGDDTGTDPIRLGPNAEDSERFVYLAFYRDGGATTGTMHLVARGPDDPWTKFTTVATGLLLKRWYDIRVHLDLAKGTYDVYVDGQYQATVAARTPKSSVTHISFAEWADGPGTFYVDNVTAQGPGGLAWSTYLGGTSDDWGNGIAVDASGNVYVTGRTFSSGWTSGGFDTSYNGGDDDGFVAKFNSAGAHLWSTYLGGTGDDGGCGIAVDAAGNVYVTGSTSSSGWTSGGFDTSYNGGDGDGFVAKLSPNGAHLWSTYLGGTGDDWAQGIAVDAAGNVYVTGHTSSSGWTSGGFDTSYNGSQDGFVAKLSTNGAHLWSTYLGGTDYEWGFGIAVDASGNVYVTGETQSPGWTSGGFDTSFNGARDAFVAKLSTNGAHLWSTYLGGTDYDWGEGIAVDASGNVYVTGGTYSPGWTSGGFDTSFNGGDDDVFLAKLSTNGAHLWSTYLGGTGADDSGGIAVDAWGNVYVTGGTYSPGWTTGGFDTSYNGKWDAFVAKLE